VVVDNAPWSNDRNHDRSIRLDFPRVRIYSEP